MDVDTGEPDLLWVVLRWHWAMRILGVVALLPRVAVAKALVLAVTLTRHDGVWS